MSSVFGNKIRVSIFGQSHGEKIGCVVDGLPAGEAIDLEELRCFLSRRAPGQKGTTPRRETDEPHIVSGLLNGKTCGAPLCVLMDNADTHSGDYDELRDVPRPGHADYPAAVKYRGFQDARGGGHFSARLTAPLCAAGGILLQLLGRRGVRVGAHLLSVGDVRDEAFDPLLTDDATLDRLKEGFPVLSPAQGEKMLEKVEEMRALGDSVGGVIECAVLHLPVGLGGPMFDGLENRISQAVFAIPAVKGIEFGEGFACAKMKGSQNNDPYMWQDGKPMLGSNHAGGILGGLTDGAPILFRAAFKPTPSIFKEQQTVDIRTGENKTLFLKGRHDPAIIHRARIVVDSMTAFVLADFLSMRYGTDHLAD